MKRTKDIIVSTTPSIEGMKIIKHLQPISAHIVLGTNVFSDFLGGLTDVFGGKSSSYQKRLNSIYEDAVKKIKYSCYEVGGNCVIGLKIDIDEISGKGKSMFMITAIGTAVISEIERTNVTKHQTISEKISLDEVNDLRNKNWIIRKAQNDSLKLDNETWNFITGNQMIEILPYLLNEISYLSENASHTLGEFIEKLKIYIDNLPDDKRREDLYSFLVTNDNKTSASKVGTIIKELFLLDFDKTINLIENEELSKKKIGLSIATFDKSHYDINDIDGFNRMKKSIELSFKERGEKTTKKQILSSKEKEMWICECSKSNHSESIYCSKCGDDIFGFNFQELKPNRVIEILEDKVELITKLTEV